MIRLTLKNPMTMRASKVLIIVVAIAAAAMLELAGGGGQLYAQQPKLRLKLTFDGPVGSQPSKAIWHFDKGWDPNCGTFYTDKPDVLRIVRDPQAQGGKALAIMVRRYPGKPGAYISGRINTSAYSRGNFTYGMVEARIKVPGGPGNAGSGSWPAFWMLGSNFKQVGWPQCGEIDIMESAGNRPSVITGTIHGPNVGAGSPYRLPHKRQFWQHYHVFQVFWSPGSIQFACDSHVYACFTPSDQVRGGWVFDHPFYIILNVAEGGAYGGATAKSAKFPQTMLVNWVKVYGWNLHIPQHLRAVRLKSGVVNLTWRDATYDQTGFEIERSTSATFATLDRRWLIAPNLSAWVDRSSAAAGTYYYRMAALAPRLKSARLETPTIKSRAVKHSLSPKRWIMSAFTPAVLATDATANRPATWSSQPVLAINCGDLKPHGAFRADVGFADGGTPEHGTNHVIRVAGVPGAAPQVVYQYSRFGSFTYHLRGLVPGKKYQVVLYLAEYYWRGPRKRLFAVFANYHLKLSDFDIYAQAGGRYRAVDESFTCHASKRGTILLKFVSQRDNAQVNGIAVFKSRRRTGG